MPAPIGYHAMRLRWCGLALLGFLKRWGVYALVAAAALSGGVSGAGQIVAAAAAWLVLPLFHAAAAWQWLLPAVLLQSALGAMLVWGMRPLLWPRGWAQAERVLPIQAGERIRSDAIVVAIGLLPLMLLYIVGATTLLAHDPAWLHPLRGRAVASLLAVAAGSVAGGAALLGWQRRASGARGERAVTRRAGEARPALVPARWPRVLLMWPLWRGPARRSGRAMLWATIGLCLPAATMMAAPSRAPWCLAAFAAVLLIAVTRIESLARAEWAALWEACTMLPLPSRAMRRARAGLVLVPALPGAAALSLALPRPGLRYGVLWAYAVACVIACVAELTAPAGADSTSRSSRWLFSLVLLLALASEVVA